ncbi:unnamed protein product [Penicillium olsonii]|nr:unnamed protein product [Penicillium olsonii]
MRLFSTWLSGLAFSPLALAFWPSSDVYNSVQVPESPYNNDQPKVKVETLFQFPNNGSWIDNMVVRSDGNLLLTRLDTPEVWQVNTTSGNATLVHSFPNVTSCFGISEIADDVFAVVIGDFDSKTYQPTAGSFSVQKLDFSEKNATQDERALAGPIASEIAAVPESLALNGMATFAQDSNLVLVADSLMGVIWKVDTETGDYAVALNHTTMTAAPGPLPLGINSCTVLGEYVYYTSTTRMQYCRVKVDKQANAVGDYEVIASGFLPDNIELTPDGTAYIPTDPQNGVVRITPLGQIALVAGGQISMEMPGPTSTRLSKDRDVLYVGTSGGQIAPVLGTFTEPAKVVKITLQS